MSPNWGIGLFLIGLASGVAVAFRFHNKVWRKYVTLLDFITRLRLRVEELPENLRKELIALLEEKD